jgi:hypothetical protein
VFFRALLHMEFYFTARLRLLGLLASLC